MDRSIPSKLSWRISMLTIKYQGQFKKDYKLAVRRGCDIKELEK